MRNDKGQFVKGSHWREHRPHWDREWLVARYVDQQLSASEIAAIAGCTENNVYYWMDKHNIPRRSIHGARAVKHWGVSGEDNPMHGRTGAMNPRYVDGSSPERQRLYARGSGKSFLRRILKRDGYRCRRCSTPSRGRKSLHVHHIKPWAGNPKLRFDENNVVTLCAKCHSWVHSNDNTEGAFLDA